MNKIISIFLLVLISSLTSVVSFADDAKHHKGEDLHEKKCTSCHSSSVYSRNDKMVKTMSALEHQVNNCMKGAAKAEWTKAETTSVVDYLNDRYYKF